MTSRWRKLSKWLVLFSLAASAAAQQDPAATLKDADRLFWRDNFAKARPLFAEAEALFAAAGDDRNALYARIGRLRADGDRTGYPAVSQYLAEQLATPLVQRDPQLRLRCLIVKASIDLSIDPASSTATWKEAQKLAIELKESGWENRAKAELSILSFLDGNTQEAQKAIGEAIMTSMLSGDVAGQVRQLSLVAVGLGELGLNDRALRYSEQALKIATSNPEVRFPLMAHMARLKSLDALGRASEADQNLKQVLEFVESAGMAVYRADVLLAVGLRDAEKGRIDEAIANLERAVASANAVGMPRPAAAALFRLAEIHERRGDLAAAESAADRALEFMRQLVDMYVLPQELATVAGIKDRAGKPQDAALLYEEAADLVEAMLVNVPTAGLRGNLIAIMSTIYEGYSDLALRRLRNPKLAFRIVERARGRAAADALRSMEPAAPFPVNSPVARDISQLQIKLQSTRSPSVRRQLLAKLAEAEERLSGHAIGSVPRTLVTSEPVTIEGLRRTLRDDEVVLEYVLGARAAYVMVVDKATFEFVPLPSRDSIRADVRQVLDQIKSRKDPSPDSFRRLSAALLPRSISQRKRIIVVPDAVLHLFPFEILTNSMGQPLIESHTLTYAPSSTILSLLRSRPVTDSNRLPLLAVGGVGVRDSDIGTGATDQLYRTTRGLFDPTGANLPVLPATDREVDSVQAVLGQRSVILKRAAATESAFKRQPLDRFRVLHLAVHGVVDQKFPERSALMMNPSAADHEDGLLQIREITSLRLNADLVTLSACDTSLGRIEGQEGVANFVRAFLIAGARNVVSALWEVDDSMTALLMQRF